ncbi:MAG: S8 family serine peptidase [Dokdonella sp.]|uniref:S8 family serine peptidase n=1 Tax=Dokdonella sp. TaxID=2291710 RepID=UPI003264D4BE
MLHNTRHINGGVLAVGIAAALFATPLFARQPVPQNLGYGLDKLVQSDVALRSGGAIGPLFNGYATQAAADYAARAIKDAATGRVLVDIVLNGRVPVATVRDALVASVPGMTISAVDAKYRHAGIIEAYVTVADVQILAQAKGVKSVFLALQPELDSVHVDTGTVASPPTSAGPNPQVAPGETLFKLGSTFDQGVIQHRVDEINQFYNHDAPVNWDGAGITIAAMSDSYDTRAAGPHAADGVASFDLPGSASHPLNTEPVFVLVEGPAGATDEGRGMVEILHKMAPRARLGFASGSLGEVGFAESIRQLSGIPANANGFKADVITDDISYGGEPFYGESIIGGAIDEVAAAGVSYFSSAGNNIGINAYESDLRIVPNGTGDTSDTNSALAGTNIDLTGVPANLYAGGFHNFSPETGALDVAQLVNMPTSAQSSEMQWDDPYDQRDLVLGPQIFASTGTIGGGVTSVTFDATTTPALPPFTQGTSYVIQETATSGNFDGIVNIYDASNTLIVSQDTGTDETVQFYPPTSGQYRIVITPYSTTTGSFTLTVNTANGVAGVTTDLNLLVFRADTGAYIASTSLTSNNLANNRPVELGSIASPSGQTQIQFVIARANTPAATQLPTRVRWSVRGNGAGGIGPAEYFTYNAVTTKGHATAKGCNGTAAFSVFRANQPETYTSPGPATILFDSDSNRLAVPDVRQQPRVAAADAANTSAFGGDSTGDLDSNPNFSGTSAAAPHAAAIAALVLQSRGGPGSVTPTEMTTILQQSAFPHDLDPSSASGVATTSDGGTVTITVNSDGDSNTATGLNDPNSIAVSFTGTGSITSLTFNPAGTATTAGNVTGGNSGYIDDAGSSPATLTYFENDYPGLVFQPAAKAFTLGSLVGLTAGDITQPQNAAPYTGFANLAPAPSNGTSQFWSMTIGFTSGAFSAGKEMRFTVGRGSQHNAATGNGTVIGPGATSISPLADLWGGGVFLPRGAVVTDGMTFTGTTDGGGTFTGTIKNAIGHGYSRVDGYGFINAAAATTVVSDVIFANGFE